MDYLLSSLQYLAQLFDTYANLIGAASTFAIALLTVFLWAENRRMRKAGAAPEVVAYLTPHPDGHGGIQFVLANVGRGPAYGLTFEFIYDEKDFASHAVMLVNDKERTPLTVLPQDEKLASLFGISFELYGGVKGEKTAPLKPFKVLMRYSDSAGRKWKRERTIDIRQFAGLRGIFDKSHGRQIAHSLEAVEKHLATIARQSNRFVGFVDTTEIADAFAQKAKGKEPGAAE